MFHVTVIRQNRNNQGQAPHNVGPDHDQSILYTYSECAK